MIYTDDTPTWHDVETLYGHDMFDGGNPYPIWDEGKREWLNSAIADHFRYRRFAVETGTLAVYYLNRRLREMMPSVNPVFAALDAENDILSTYRTTDSTDTSRTSENASSQLYSDTPQAQLSDLKDYATNLTEGESKGSDAGMTVAVHTGRSATVGEQISRWVGSVNNALYIVFNGLEPLFMQIWDEEGF